MSKPAAIDLRASLFVTADRHPATACEVWTLTPDAVRAVCAEIKAAGKMTAGGYWTAHLRDAKRSARKGDLAEVTTAGFSTPELSNFLHLAGVEKITAARFEDRAAVLAPVAL